MRRRRLPGPAPLRLTRLGAPFVAAILCGAALLVAGVALPKSSVRPGRDGIGALEERVRAELRRDQPPVEPLTGPVRVRALEIEWDPPGAAPLLYVDSILGTLDASRLLVGDVVVSRLALYAPTLNVVRPAGAAVWNYQTAIDRLLGPDRPSPAPSTSPRRSVLFEDVTISGGMVLVSPEPGDSITALDLDATIPRIAISGPRTTTPVAEISRLDAKLLLAARETALPVAVGDATLRFPTGELDFDAARLELAASSFTAVRGGLVFAAPGLGLEATAHAERVELADLHSFLPRAPTSGNAVFDLSITTNAAGRHALQVTALELDAEGSAIRGSFGIAFGGALPPAPHSADLTLDPLDVALIEEFTGPLPYDGSIRGRIRGPATRLEFDFTARLTTPSVVEPFDAGLTGVVGFADDGLRLAHLDIDLRRVPLVAFRPFIPGLALTGVVSGHVVLEGTPGEVPMRIDVRLHIAAGALTLSGVIDLSGAAPSYDLSGNLYEIRLQEIFEPPLPPVSLTARYSLTGSGVRPAATTARLRFAGNFTGWQAGPADSINVDVAFDRGTLALDELRLRLATVDLSASGIWHFEPPTSGGIEYRLSATTLAPFAPYLASVGAPGLASGPLLAVGSISGLLASPRVAGTLDAAGLVYDGWRADTLAATYDLVVQRPLTAAEIHLTAEGIETPIGPYTTAALDFAIVDSLIHVDLNATGGAGRGPLVLVASGRVDPDGRSDLTVRRLDFELDGSTWSLVQPARIAWGGAPGMMIEGFLLREIDGPGLVAIDGSYPPDQAGDLRVEAVDLPIAEILTLAGYQPTLIGTISLDLRVGGPPENATIDGSFTLADASYRGQAIDVVQGTILAEGRRLDALVTAQLDTAGMVRVDASIPFILDLTAIPDLTIPRDEALRVTATADSLALRLLALSLPEVQDVAGSLHADIELTGTPARPLLSGNARIRDGAVTVIPLNQRYDQISADLVLREQTLELVEAVVHSGGWATVTGTVTFADLADPTLALRAIFDDFQALGVDDLDPADLNGELRVTGTLQSPVIAGAVTVDDGNVSIAPFQSSGTTLSDELAVTSFTGDTTAAQGEGSGRSWYDRLVLDSVVVTAGDNLWVVADEFRARLAGELILDKDEEGLRVAGTLEGDRGTFTLRVGPLVRRFTLVRTNIRFFGTTDLDPAIDVTASRLVPGADGQMTEVLINLTGTLDEPTVSVTTGTGAEVPESELISFLLFGRPSFAAPGEPPLGGPVLEEAVFGIGSLAEVASIGLETALSAELGLPLDYFLIQPTQGPFGGLGAATIVIGQEIAPNVFVTVNTGFGGLFGISGSPANAWSVSLQWRITREWTLELAVEPVNPARFFRGLGTALPIVGVERQLILELQRRWTY